MEQGARFDRVFLIAHAEHHRPFDHEERFIPGMAVGRWSGAVGTAGVEGLEALGLVAADQGLDIDAGHPHRGGPIRGDTLPALIRAAEATQRGLDTSDNAAIIAMMTELALISSGPFESNAKTPVTSPSRSFNSCIATSCIASPPISAILCNRIAVI
jgi:hypothetical protein